MAFGEKLRRARLALNMSQKELAVQAGIGERSVHNYEQNGMYPQASKLNKIAEVLNVTVSYLFGDDEPGQSSSADQESFLNSAKEQFGYKGRREAQEVLERANALFAGGDLEESDKEIFFQSLMESYLESKGDARKKFSPKKRVSRKR